MEGYQGARSLGRRSGSVRGRATPRNARMLERMEFSETWADATEWESTDEEMPEESAPLGTMKTAQQRQIQGGSASESNQSGPGNPVSIPASRCHSGFLVTTAPSSSRAEDLAPLEGAASEIPDRRGPQGEGEAAPYVSPYQVVRKLKQSAPSESTFHSRKELMGKAGSLGLLGGMPNDMSDFAMDCSSED